VSDLSGTVQDEERHFRIRQVPTAFEDGTDGITLIIEDVTSQKRYQQMLEISEARYRGIVQSSGEVIIGMTPAGQITSWNPAAQRLYGYSEAEILTQPVHKLVPETGHRNLDGILSRVTCGECIQKHEMMMVCKEGTAIDALVTICPIRGEDHRIVGASAIIRDITREKLEQHVREREDRYRTLVEDLNVGIYRSTGDPSGRFVWGNTALLRILGYRSLTDLEGIKVTDIFSEPDGRAELLEELKKSGFVKNRILNLHRPDGTPINVSVTALAEFDQKKDLIFINGIVQDISGMDRSQMKPSGT
jgi:PAS domain S-box-containing protein